MVASLTFVSDKIVPGCHSSVAKEAVSNVFCATLICPNRINVLRHASRASPVWFLMRVRSTGNTHNLCMRDHLKTVRLLQWAIPDNLRVCDLVEAFNRALNGTDPWTKKPFFSRAARPSS